jgi:N-acyl-D-amino-acid deacylase
MSLLIKNVQIIDGEGKPAYKSDVYIQKNIISAIGDLKDKEAEEVIDGLGNYLVPGFIDIDTDSDHYLDIFTNPRQEDFSKQGVTTIIGGQCGASLAPLMYGTLESIKQWSNPDLVNVDWHTMAEFLHTLDKVPLGVNFGTLAGHSTMRRSLAGDTERGLTKNEIEILKRVLHQTIKDGAFGLSMGLGYVQGRIATEEEIRELTKLLKSLNAVLSVHLRSQTDELLNSVHEAAKIASEAGVKTVISHFRPIVGYENQFEESIKLIEESSDNLRFDIYPHETCIEPIYMLLPKWAQMDNLRIMQENIKNTEICNQIEKEFASMQLGDIEVVKAPQNDNLVGKSLVQISENLGLTHAQSLVKLMQMTNLNAIVIYKNVNFNTLIKALANDRAFIASNGNSPPKNFLKHERSTNTFPKFLEIVFKNNLMTIEAAIKKITSVPAQFFGLDTRGVVKEGKVADLVILDKNDYKIKEVILAGRSTDAKGRVLRHKYSE